jgi:translation initiation factor 3 subunit A
MRLQVEQLEKEKREQSERMRIIAKRLDHVERAYRKEERPLIAKDYEHQQAEDLEVYNKAVALKLQATRDAHAEALETKRRLSRMMEDYKAKRIEIARKRGEEFARKKEEAGRKIEEEKAQRRRATAKVREEERRKREELERISREEAAEAARLEQGKQCLALRLSL